MPVADNDPELTNAVLVAAAFARQLAERLEKSEHAGSSTLFRAACSLSWAAERLRRAAELELSVALIDGDQAPAPPSLWHNHYEARRRRAGLPGQDAGAGVTS